MSRYHVSAVPLLRVLANLGHLACSRVNLCS
jgi:hypothetical protein